MASISPFTWQIYLDFPIHVPPFLTIQRRKWHVCRYKCCLIQVNLDVKLEIISSFLRIWSMLMWMTHCPNFKTSKNYHSLSCQWFKTSLWFLHRNNSVITRTLFCCELIAYHNYAAYLTYIHLSLGTVQADACEWIGKLAMAMWTHCPLFVSKLKKLWCHESDPPWPCVADQWESKICW